MDLLWLLVLGLVLGGWAALDGFGIGVGIVLPLLARDRAGRRTVVTALGPFFLANEVWLIVGAGVLVGAFPALESELLSGFYPLTVTLLVSWVLRDVAMWFRSRRGGVSWGRGWDAVLVGASTSFAFSWGLLLANVAQGVPARHSHVGALALLDPFALLCGMTVVLLFALHGAVFTANRVTGPVAVRAVHLGRWLAPVAAGAVVAATVARALSTPVRETATGSAQAALALLAVAAVTAGAAGPLLSARRSGWALSGTAMAAAAPTLAVGTAVATRLLAGAADDVSLRRLAVLTLPVLALVVVAQAWLWYVFRHRVDARSAAFF